MGVIMVYKPTYNCPPPILHILHGTPPKDSDKLTYNLVITRIYVVYKCITIDYKLSLSIINYHEVFIILTISNGFNYY